MNNKNDKSISRSRLTGKYLTRNDILKMSAIKAKNNILEEELAHHGILGMKWGVRRYQPYPKGHNQLKKGGKFTGKKTTPRPKRQSKKSREREELSKLSDNELRTRLNRLNMEQQYSSLKNKTNKTAITIAAGVVGGIIVNAAKESSKNFISRQMTKGYKQIATKITSSIATASTKRRLGKVVRSFKNAGG